MLKNIWKFIHILCALDFESDSHLVCLGYENVLAYIMLKYYNMCEYSNWKFSIVFPSFSTLSHSILHTYYSNPSSSGVCMCQTASAFVYARCVSVCHLKIISLKCLKAEHISAVAIEIIGKVVSYIQLWLCYCVLAVSCMLELVQPSRFSAAFCVIVGPYAFLFLITFYEKFEFSLRPILFALVCCVRLFLCMSTYEFQYMLWIRIYAR